MIYLPFRRYISDANPPKEVNKDKIYPYEKGKLKCLIFGWRYFLHCWVASFVVLNLLFSYSYLSDMVFVITVLLWVAMLYVRYSIDVDRLEYDNALRRELEAKEKDASKQYKKSSKKQKMK